MDNGQEAGIWGGTTEEERRQLRRRRRRTNSPGSGSPSASARCWPCSRPAGPPRDRAGPVHQQQDRQRARVEHPGPAGRQRPGEAAAVAHRLGVYGPAARQGRTA